MDDIAAKLMLEALGSAERVCPQPRPEEWTPVCAACIRFADNPTRERLRILRLAAADILEATRNVPANGCGTLTESAMAHALCAMTLWKVADEIVNTNGNYWAMIRCIAACWEETARIADEFAIIGMGDPLIEPYARNVAQRLAC